jgi:hypothetical protein
VAFVVAHNLGRAWASVGVVSQTSGTALCLVRTATTYTPTQDPAKSIALLPSATATIYLRIA